VTCGNCGAELPEKSRFCPQCGEARAAICPACQHGNALGSRFCNQCGARLEAQQLSKPQITTLPAAPTAPAAERRQLTVMFCDLVGSTARSTLLDPEDLQEVIANYHRCVADVIGSYDGCVAQYLGDGALIFFGYPRAHEDDAERAVHAALEIARSVPSLRTHDQRLEVRVGIATGPVVVGEIIGASPSPEKGAIGETPNLAARLQAIAAPSTIVVSASTQRLAHRQFQYRDLGHHDLKGFTQAVQAWQVLGGISPESRLMAWSAPNAPLVGRRAELAQLCSVIETCKDRARGRAIIIRGEAGIGKTRLLEEFCSIARSQGFMCHAGLVLDFGAGTGRDAIAGLVRGLLGLTPSTDMETITAVVASAVKDGTITGDESIFINDLVGISLPPELHVLYNAMDNSTREAGRRRSIVHLVEHASHVQPRVLAVEDLHWADRASLSYLALLTAAVTNCPAILVMTTRLEQDPLDQAWRSEAGGSPLSVIELGPLHSDEATELAAPFIEANSAIATRCVERAAGNPLFLEQLLRNALEGADAAVPGSIQSLVQARLDRLGAFDKAAIQTAAVLGQRFDREALAYLLEQPDYNPEGLLARHMIRTSGGELHFDHALIQEAIYNGLLRSRRRELHTRAANWFDGRDKVLKAAHLDRAGASAAAAAYLEAARLEVGHYRFNSARRLVERGFELSANHADRFALAYLLGDILHQLGEMPRALDAFVRSLSVASSDVERCRALIGCARVKRVIDDLDGAFADLERAEGVAVARGFKVEEAQLRFLRGNLAFPRGDVETSLREHKRSLELARDADAPQCEADALGGLGDAEYLCGRIISARRNFQSCIMLADRHGLGRVGAANRPMAAFARWLIGDTREALVEAREAIDGARRVGHKRAEMIAHHAAYFCLESLAQFELAADHAMQSLLLARELHAPRFEAQALAFCANLHRLRGNPVEANSAIEQGLAVARKTGMTYMGPFMLGIAALITNDRTLKYELLSEADEILTTGAVSHNHLLFPKDAIDVCLEIVDWERANQYAAQLEAYTRAEPLPLTAFFVARGRALATIGQDARRFDLFPEVNCLIAEAERLGCLMAMPALKSALADRNAIGRIGTGDLDDQHHNASQD
jgi:class 3 adenylate cyclase/tetratricopeptide (TPR) repeat protein